MTTQTTTIQPSTTGLRALIGATAASLALLGGALLWEARSNSETATLAPTPGISTSSEGVAPLGGLAEQYREQQQAQAEHAAAHVTTRGGMAEFYVEQGVPVVRTAAVTPLGGLAELYRDQAVTASRAR